MVMLAYCLAVDNGHQRNKLYRLVWNGYAIYISQCLWVASSDLAHLSYDVPQGYFLVFKWASMLTLLSLDLSNKIVNKKHKTNEFVFRSFLGGVAKIWLWCLPFASPNRIGSEVLVRLLLWNLKPASMISRKVVKVPLSQLVVAAQVYFPMTWE